MKQLVEIRNNQIVVSSRDVAVNFGKEHKHVLDNIRQILVAENSATKFFEESSHKYRGREFPEYLMNRDGFSLLVMGFTGAKALQWKIKYINAFNEMEAKLKGIQAARPMAIPQLHCKYFRGEPVITLLDLERLVGCDHAYLLYGLKRHMIPYRMLTKEDLVTYRVENNEFVCNSRLIVIIKEAVLQLLERMGRHSKENIAAVNEYFRETVSRQVENAELIIKQLSVLQKAGNMLQDLSERDMVGKFITAGLMSLGLFDPTDYPVPEHVATMDINSAPGWNKGGILLHAQHLINRGEAVTKENLKAFEQNLFMRVKQ